MKKRKLKIARGRGNQGDHAKKIYSGMVSKEHKDWNAEIERKKLEKKLSKGIGHRREA